MINKELFANQSHFHLNVQNCHIPMFVKTFSTQDVGLGQHYFMLIKLHSAKYLHLPEYLEKWAIFTVNDSINPQVLYGYLLVKVFLNGILLWNLLFIHCVRKSDHELFAICQWMKLSGIFWKSIISDVIII